MEQPSESLRQNQNVLVHRRCRSFLSEEEVQGGEFGTTYCQSVITSGLNGSIQTPISPLREWERCTFTMPGLTPGPTFAADITPPHGSSPLLGVPSRSERPAVTEGDASSPFILRQPLRTNTQSHRYPGQLGVFGNEIKRDDVRRKSR